MLIDPAIRDWVMIPLLILVVLSMYLRNYGMKYLAESKTMDNDEFTQRNLVSRSNRLRANYGYISYNGFRMRQLYLSNTDNGKLHENVKSKQMNPMGQMDMLKQQVSLMGFRRRCCTNEPRYHDTLVMVIIVYSTIEKVYEPYLHHFHHRLLRNSFSSPFFIFFSS